MKTPTPLLFLHGAIGAKDQLYPLAKVFSSDRETALLNFNGHGESDFSEKGLSIDAFAEEVKEFLDSKNWPEVNVFGYSMGGYVAAYLEKKHPGTFNKIFSLGTKWHWDPITAEKESKMLDPGKIMEKVPAFADSLKKRHGKDKWKKLLTETAKMMVDMGTKNPLQQEDFANIHVPFLLAIGDRDEMVTLYETLDVYKHLPNASLLVLPETKHPIEKVNLTILEFHLQQFFA